MRITQSEILETLAAALKSDAPEDARTIRELMRETGEDRSKITEALRALHEEGRLRSYQVKREGFDGKMRPVPAYTILPAKKKR